MTIPLKENVTDLGILGEKKRKVEDSFASGTTTSSSNSSGRKSILHLLVGERVLDSRKEKGRGDNTNVQQGVGISIASFGEKRPERPLHFFLAKGEVFWEKKKKGRKSAASLGGRGGGKVLCRTGKNLPCPAHFREGLGGEQRTDHPGLISLPGRVSRAAPERGQIKKGQTGRDYSLGKRGILAKNVKRRCNRQLLLQSDSSLTFRKSALRKNVLYLPVKEKWETI